MHLIVLHGGVGIWDEVACLAIPATVILGIALAVLREKPPPDEAPVADTPVPQADDGPAPSGQRGQGERP